jgi:hypothetical protein
MLSILFVAAAIAAALKTAGQVIASEIGDK